MKKTALFCVIISGLLFPTCSLDKVDNPVVPRQFIKLLGETGSYQGEDIQQTSDGGYIICGTWGDSASYLSPQKAFLIKTDDTGSITWEKQYYSGLATTSTVLEDSDGGFVTAGFTQNTTSPYKKSQFLLKTNSNGNLIWNRQFADTDSKDVYDVTKSKDGGFLLSGTVNTDSVTHISLRKCDNLGNSLWTKDIKYPLRNLRARSVSSTTDGGYILAGRYYDSNTFYVYLYKLDESGDIQWEKNLQIKGASTDIQALPDGSYVLSAWTEITNGVDYDYDGRIIKVDNDGDVLFNKSFNNAGGDFGLSVRHTDDNGFIYTGITNETYTPYNSEVPLIKTDNLGNEVWTKIFNLSGYEYGSAVRQTSDGGYVILGGTQTTSTSPYRVLLIKTDKDGNAQ